jgi:hypothetical protein
MDWVYRNVSIREFYDIHFKNLYDVYVIATMISLNFCRHSDWQGQFFSEESTNVACVDGLLVSLEFLEPPVKGENALVDLRTFG